MEENEFTMSAATPGRLTKGQTIAGDLVRIAGLWIAAGALFKLFEGSPKDLPRSFLEMAESKLSMNSVLAFRLVIVVELFVAIFAIFRPKIGWLPLVVTLGIFDFFLWPMVQEGAESCGCFGGAITISPIVMMSIDSALIIAVLISRPWSTMVGRPLALWLLLPLLGLSAWAPWKIFKTGKPIKQPAELVSDEPGVSDEPEEPQEIVPGSENTGEAGISNPQPEPTVQLPMFAVLETDSWEGQLLTELDLAEFLDVNYLPGDSHVVFYRTQCDHCAKHLEEMAAEPPPPLPVVLVRVPEKSDTPENEVTKIKPAYVIDELTLPALDRGYMIETPMSIDVEAMQVTAVTYHKE